jgi:hypothetical protein
MYLTSFDLIHGLNGHHGAYDQCVYLLGVAYCLVRDIVACTLVNSLVKDNVSLHS